MKLALLEKWHKEVQIFFLVSTPDRKGGYTNKTPSFKVGEGGYMKRPPVFLESGGSCLSTIVLTIS